MIKSSARKVLGVLGLLALGLSASAQVSKTGSKYLLRMHYKKGQTLRYVAESSIVMGPKQTTSVTVPMVMKVKSVVKGIADIDVTVGPVSSKGTQMQPARSANAKIDSMGRPVDGASSPMMSGSFPQKPVAVGEQWSATVPLSGMQMNVSMRFIFRGLKQVQGKTVGVIDTAIDSVSGGANLSGKGQMQVLASDGTLSSLRINMRMAVPAGKGSKGGSIAFTTTMVRK